jgi:hypothetical protein
MNPGPASSRGGVLFRGLCNLMILNFRLSWKASSSQFFGHHRSGSTFNTGHLVDSNINKKSKAILVNEIHEMKGVNMNIEK